MILSTPRRRVLFLRRFLPVLLAVFGVFSILAADLHAPKVAYAASSSTVNFQARLQTSSGAIVPDGTYNVEFKLYTDQGTSSNPVSCTSTCVWREDYTATSGPGSTDARLQVKDGYLSASLGSITAFGTGIDWSQQMYLTMDIGGTSSSASWDGEMTPRLALTATPYSFLSQRSASSAAADELSTTNANGTNTLSVQGSGSGHGSQTFVLQDQGTSGTYDLLTTQAAAGSYIQLQTGTPSAQTGSIDVTGSVIAGSIKAATFDAASSGSVSIGASTATSISLGNTTSNIGTTINGTLIVKPTASHDTTGVFQVQDAGSHALIDVDTSGTETVNLGATSAAIASTINIGTSTTASQNVNIGSGAVTTGTNTVHIGDGATSSGIDNVTIGSANSTSVTTIQGGSSSTAAIAITPSTGGGVNIGNSSGTGVITLGSSTVTNTISIGAANVATTKTQTINIGNGTDAGTGKTVVAIGSSSSASSTTIQAGTGNVQLSTGTGTTTATGAIQLSTGGTSTATSGAIQLSTGVASSTGGTGSILIQTGGSSSGVSGNVIIDTGSSSSSASGTPESYTFESGVQSWSSSFGCTTGCTVSTTGTQFHGGSNSLTISATGIWGIQSPSGTTTVTPGQLYTFTAWVRTSVAQAVGFSVHWTAPGGPISTIATITDSTTGWTKYSGTVAAPSGATTFYMQVNGPTAPATVYVDDVTVTTGMGGIIAPLIAIGNTNAASVLIGNNNGVGATTIQGGAAGVDITGATGTTVSIGTDLDNAVTIGNTAGTNTITLGQSTATNTVSIASGVTASGSTQTVNIGNGATSAGTVNINIGTGATSSGIDAVTIGSTSASSHVTLQGGTGSSAVSIQAGSAGRISVGTTNANTVNVGSTSGSATTNISAGSGGVNLNSSGGVNVGTTTSATTGTGFNVSANGLTTGFGASVNSTSEVQTAGSLFNVSSNVTLTGAAGSSMSGQLVNVSRAVTANLTGGGGTATPTLDNATSSAASTYGDYSFSYSVGSGHSNNYLLVSVVDQNYCSADGTANAPLVSYGGTSMTKIGINEFNPGGVASGHLYCYFLFGLPLGSNSGSQTLAVTGGGPGPNPNSSFWDVGVSSWYNVSQSTPYGTYVAAFSNSAPTASVTNTWPSGRVVVDNSSMYQSAYPGCTGTIAPGAGQTKAFYACYNADGVGDGGGIGISYKASTGSSLSMTWTGTGSVWGTSAVDLIGSTIPATETVTGAVATFSDNCTVTAGSCTDSADVVDVKQQYSGATGTAFTIQNAGSGYAMQIQNGSGVALFTADTSGSTITVSGTSNGSTFAIFLLNNAHFESTQSTAPTVTTAPTTGNCGSGSPTAVVSSGSTDNAGSFYINSGGSVVGTCSTTISFNKAFGTTPKAVILSPDLTLGGTPPAAGATQYPGRVTAVGTGSFTVQLGSNNATSTRYGFYYWVVQ